MKPKPPAKRDVKPREVKGGKIEPVGSNWKIEYSEPINKIICHNGKRTLVFDPDEARRRTCTSVSTENIIKIIADLLNGKT